MRIFTYKIEINGMSADLHAYLPDVPSRAMYPEKHPAVIVLPGGAYRGLADHEGEIIALQYVAAGMGAFVLKYNVYPARFPQSLREAFAAIAYVRQTAEEFCIDPNEIAICGFSAGGHLAACTGTLWNHACMKEYLEGERRLYRPDVMILSYPVIGDRFHHNSMLNLFDKNEDELTEERMELLSLEKQVDSETPTAFLWHNFGDTSVPCEASLCFASAMYRNGVTCELHLYSEGKHGGGLYNHLADKRTYSDAHFSSSWIGLSIDFLYRHFEQHLNP